VSQRTADPHAQSEVLHAGAPLDSATAAVILIHGRGATASNILRLARNLTEGLKNGENIAFLAPQAAGNTWYPLPFLAPLEQNEPYLSSALGMIDRTVDAVAAAGLPTKTIMLAGFSQGACLSLEYAARGSRPLGAVAGLSGALIGPPDVEHAPLADVSDLPVFIGVGEYDDHVAPSYVEKTATLFEEAGAKVDFRFYEAMGHSMTEDEIYAMREMIAALPGE
jgi:predicted esterase